MGLYLCLSSLHRALTAMQACVHWRETRPGREGGGLASPCSYLQNDGGSWLLVQDSSRAEQLKGRVGVVDELGVVVNQQGLDVVKDKSKLVWPLHGVQAGPIVRGQRGCQAGQGGGVHNFAHLRGPERRVPAPSWRHGGVTLPSSHPLLRLAHLQRAACFGRRAVKLYSLLWLVLFLCVCRGRDVF